MKHEELLQRAISRRRLMINAAIAAGGAVTIASSSLGYFSNAITKDGPAEKWPLPQVKLEPGKT